MSAWRFCRATRKSEEVKEWERKGDLRTWRPAREEREIGFFLSLSLLAAEVLPVINPFAPFPDIFYRQNSRRCCAERRGERKIEREDEGRSQTLMKVISNRHRGKGFEVVSWSFLPRFFISLFFPHTHSLILKLSSNYIATPYLIVFTHFHRKLVF